MAKAWNFYLFIYLALTRNDNERPKPDAYMAWVRVRRLQVLLLNQSLKEGRKKNNHYNNDSDNDNDNNDDNDNDDDNNNDDDYKHQMLSSSRFVWSRLCRTVCFVVINLAFSLCTPLYQWVQAIKRSEYRNKRPSFCPGRNPG